MSKKISNRPVALSVAGEDLLAIITDPTGARIEKQVSVDVLGAGGGGSDIVVEDESIQLTAGVIKLNFLGSGVTASIAAANEVDVTIPGGGATVPQIAKATFDGGGFALEAATGPGFVPILNNGTITGWTLIADVVGSIVIDVWKLAGAVPTIANTITNLNEPELSADDYTQGDPVADGWLSGATVVTGDVLGFKIISTSTITWASLTLEIG